MATNKKPNEIYITRLYDAPVKMVWDAWVEPDQVAQWWGPRGFTITTKSKDVRTGGHWDYTMHGPDGKDWPNVTKYLEVEKYSRMVYDHGGTKDTPPLFRVTVTFTDVKGKTKMDMTMALATPEAAKETKKFIKQAGGDSTWDRLAEFLGDENGEKKFVINRSFEAPINTVFDMWTKPEHVSQWLPPTGMNMKFLKANITPGGHSAYAMFPVGDETKAMYGRIDYISMTRPNLLTYTQIFTDKDGNLSRHPMAPTWPAVMHTTVNFTEEGENQTRITVTWKVEGQATVEEMKTFLTSRAGMTQGWTGSFDKFEDYLQKN